MSDIDIWAGKQPRDWQLRALPLILQSLRRKEKGIVSAVMGSGKSRLAGAICASGRGRVLVTAPSIRLVEQLGATLAEHCPGEVGRYYTHAKQADQRITVACIDSIPSLLDDPNWQGPPALMIIDEAHSSQAATVLDAYERIAPERLVGFTATAFRASEREELSLFDREIYAYGLADAIRDGVIVPFRAIQWDGGDDVPIDDACVAMIRRHASGPGLANATSIADAQQFADRLSAEGIPAESIHSQRTDAENSATLARLESGDLAAVVHVNMLAEGVDLPWLRWLCLRRLVGSRVRFCQEVGRVLRAAPGKAEALLLDPHDLLGAFALSYQAVLAGMIEIPESAEPLAAELREATAYDFADDDLRPKALAAWHRYLRRLYLAGVGCGAIECRVKSTRWRPYAATASQIPLVDRLLGGLVRDTAIPLPHRKALKLIGEHARELTRGDVSDLIALQFAFRDARKRKEILWEKIAETEK